MTWSGLGQFKAAALGFLVSAAYWPGLLAAAFIPRWAVIAAGVPLVSNLDPRNLPESVRWLLVFMLALGGVSLLGSPAPWGGAQDLIFLVILCGAMLAGASLSSLNGLMLGAVAGLSISSALSVSQVYFGWPQAHSTSPIGLFMNSEVMAEFAAILAVWCIVSRRWALAVVAVIPVVLAHSRVSFVAIGIALLYAFWPRSRAQAAALIVLLIGAAIASLVALGTGKVTTAGLRVVIWGATAMAITPLGNGLGWFHAAHPTEQFAHSDVLQALAELGPLIAVMAFIPALALWRRQEHHAERAAFVVVCVECLISFPLHFPATGFMAAVLAGHLVGVRPVVRMGACHSRDADGARLQRAKTGCRGPSIPSGWRGFEVSV